MLSNRAQHVWKPALIHRQEMCFTLEVRAIWRRFTSGEASATDWMTASIVQMMSWSSTYLHEQYQTAFSICVVELAFYQFGFWCYRDDWPHLVKVANHVSYATIAMFRSSLQRYAAPGFWTRTNQEFQRQAKFSKSAEYPWGSSLTIQSTQLGSIEKNDDSSTSTRLRRSPDLNMDEDHDRSNCWGLLRSAHRSDAWWSIDIYAPSHTLSRRYIDETATRSTRRYENWLCCVQKSGPRKNFVRWALLECWAILVSSSACQKRWAEIFCEHSDRFDYRVRHPSTQAVD